MNWIWWTLKVLLRWVIWEGKDISEMLLRDLVVNHFHTDKWIPQEAVFIVGIPSCRNVLSVANIFKFDHSSISEWINWRPLASELRSWTTEVVQFVKSGLNLVLVELLKDELNYRSL
jgi:hypothetical protein